MIVSPQTMSYKKNSSQDENHRKLIKKEGSKGLMHIHLKKNKENNTKQYTSQMFFQIHTLPISGCNGKTEQSITL